MPTRASWDGSLQDGSSKACRDKGIPLPREFFEQMEYEDADHLTQAIVAEAILKFRDLLREDGWSPRRGAKLTTYFVGQCVICFPNQYRKWDKAWRARSSVPLSEVDDQNLRQHRMPDQTDPAETAVNRVYLEEVAKQLDPLTFQVLQLQAMGFPVAAIAEALDKTPKAIEMLLYRHRRRTYGKGEKE